MWWGVVFFGWGCGGDFVVEGFEGGVFEGLEVWRGRYGDGDFFDDGEVF